MPPNYYGRGIRARREGNRFEILGTVCTRIRMYDRPVCKASGRKTLYVVINARVHRTRLAFIIIIIVITDDSPGTVANRYRCYYNARAHHTYGIPRARLPP